MTKLTDLCDIQYGYAFDSSYFTEDSSYIPIVRIRDVKRGFSKTHYSSIFPVEYVIHKGDLLVGMDGEFNIAKWQSSDALLNQRVCKLTAKEGMNKEYLRYAMIKALKDLENKTSFVTVKHLTAKELNRLELNVPSVSIQNQRENTLSALEKIMHFRREQLKSLDELIKARFIEMFGDLKSNEKDWDLKTFEEMSVLITDGEHSTPKRTKEGIYLLSARNVLNHSLQLKDVDYINRDEYLRIAKRVVPKKGDILISCSGTIGRCCSVPDSLQLQMVRSVALIRFKEVINPIFAEYMITSDYLQEQINSSKTMSSQANLFQGKIRKLKGFLPPTELQQQFADFVRQVDKSRFDIKKSITELEREVVYD